jgi:Secretion system C-terminal sorting domain/Kelch motif
MKKKLLNHFPLKKIKTCSLSLLTRNGSLLVILLCVLSSRIIAQGTWTAVAKAAPHSNNATMILLSDGTVLAHSGSGSSNGTIWDKLTPDKNGSYINGTWTSMAPMKDDRLFFSSNLLKDGRLYVAGGEYGSGGSSAEVYNPLTNTWTSCPAPGGLISDANSMILEDGRVLQALVGVAKTTKIYNPKTNSYTAGPTGFGSNNESSWVKLPDNSIIYVDINSKSSERYIPASNSWIKDANVPVSVYDPYGSETGGAWLLPNGRLFHLSSLGTNALYTPSGTTSPGTWVAAAVTPGSQGTPDAPGAMMPNGKILCAVSPLPTSAEHFPSPTKFYEYDYLSDSFTAVSAPGGATSLNSATYTLHILLLPDGSAMLGQTGSSKYYVYSSPGTPVASGKPKIGKINVTNNSGTCTYTVTGTGFNGISEGSTYGDDEFNSTNYPLIRLSSGTDVYYARTFNWNSTGVMRGTKPDTTQFTLPAGFPTSGTFSMVVVANGIASDPVVFTPCIGEVTAVNNLTAPDNLISVFPNPASENASIRFTVNEAGNYTLKLLDVVGRTVIEETGRTHAGDNAHLLNLNAVAKGVYTISLTQGTDMYVTKMLVN